MTTLQLFSEPFARTGNIAGEGFRRLLGRPALGLLQTVVRESLQNSIDAAKSGRGPVILLRVRALAPSEAACLRESVLTSMPSDPRAQKSIEKSTSPEVVRVFEICDFKTTGLGGPVRADTPAEGEDESNFVNFIRNVGVARDTYQGGGTYGYGKTSLYAMSICSTIVVDSIGRYNGSPTRRFIGCHLGDTFDANLPTGELRRYTGRHWWGVADDLDGIDPLEADGASRLAEGLGMPIRAEEDSGSSIMIVDPAFTSKSSDDIANELVETVLWNFWPRMTRTTPESHRLTVKIEVDGIDIPLPEPENFPPLDLFSDALADLRAESGSCVVIRSQRPAKELGRMSIKRGVIAERIGPGLREGSIIPRQNACIALMRPVELVVKYLQGEPFADSRYEWAGVFKCSEEDEVEEAFASAEPPAHDDWVPENLPKGSAKTWVRVALREVTSAARNYVIPYTNRTTEGERGTSLARTASIMGRLLDRTSGRGPGRGSGRTGSGGSSRGRTSGVSQPTFEQLRIDDKGGALAVFTANLTNDGRNLKLALIAKPHLVADGGATDSGGLASAFHLAVRSIRLRDHDIRAEGSKLEIGGREGVVEVIVPMPKDAAVGLRLQLIEDELS